MKRSRTSEHYAAATCAMPRSLCGGFWWQTLDQFGLREGKE